MSSVAQSAFATGVSAGHLNAVGEDGNLRPKLKPFHWDKVQANPDHSMVWDKIRAGSFQFNEEMIETLFGYNSANTSSGVAKQSVIPPSQTLHLLDPKKSQNLAILLRALNVTKEEVCDALFEGEGLSPQLLETLVKMAPTKEEERKLKDYNGDVSKLGPAERFLKALVNIPLAFERFDAMLYRENFREEVSYIRESYETLEAGCKELRCSRLFLKLLEAVLKTGNRMNVGTYRGGAQAFKLDTLLKLADVKGIDGKTTLLHFVVQEIVRAEGMRAARAGQQSGSNTTSNVIDRPTYHISSENESSEDREDYVRTHAGPQSVSNTTSSVVDGQTYPTSGENETSEDREDYYRTLGLQVLANLSADLCNVKKAAAIDSHALTGAVSKLARGLAKMKSFLQIEFTSQKRDENASKNVPEGIFHQSMGSFLQQAEEEIKQIQGKEARVFSHVKEITKYFHGNAAKEEAHPFRIFVIVRDFTSMLDQVCKEVGRMQKRNPPISSQKGPSSTSDHNLSRSLFPTDFDRNVNSLDLESSTP